MLRNSNAPPRGRRNLRPGMPFLATLLFLAGGAPSRAAKASAWLTSSEEPEAESPPAKVEQQAQRSRIQPGEELEVVVETGTRSGHTRKNAPIRTGVIQESELVDVGADSVKQALVGAPVVEIDGDAHGGAPTVQGLEPEHLLILRDGQRITGRVAGRIDLNRLFSLRYESVEWVAGRASSLYGSDAIAGAINLRTRWPKKGWDSAVRASGGNYRFGSAFAAVGWAGRSQAYMASFAWMRRDAIDLDPQTPATNGDAQRQHDGEFGARWRLSSKIRLALLAGVGRQYFQGRDQNAAGAVLIRSTRNYSPRADLKLEWLHQRANTEINAHYNSVFNRQVFDQRGDDALDGRDDTEDQVYSLEAIHRRNFGNRHRFLVGTQLQMELMKGKRIGGRPRQRPRAALFAQDEWQLDGQGKWILLPSARVDWDRYFRLAITPQLAAMWMPSKSLQLRASVGQGYRAPSFKDLFMEFNNPSAGYRVRGNPDLKAERSVGANASVDWEFLAGLQWSVEYFEQQLLNLIAPIPGKEADFDGLSFRYQNVGRASTRGVETSLDRSGFDWLSLDLGYRFLHSKNHDQDRPLQGRPRHRLRSRALFKYADWGTRLRLAFSANLGQRFFVADPDNEGVVLEKVLDPQWMLSLSAFQRIYGALELFGRVDNLLNAGDLRFAPRPRRAFFAGLQWSYGRGR